MDDSCVVEAGEGSPNRRHEGRHAAKASERIHPLAISCSLLLFLPVLSSFLRFAIGVALNFVPSPNLNLTLRAATQHLTHAPPLYALHGQRTARLVDPQYARHRDAGLGAARERARLELQTGLGEGRVERGVAVGFGKAVLKDRGCGCGCRGGGGGRGVRRGIVDAGCWE